MTPPHFAALCMTGTLTPVMHLAEGDIVHLEPHAYHGHTAGHRVLDVEVTGTGPAAGDADGVLLAWRAAPFPGSPPRSCGVSVFARLASVLVIGHHAAVAS